MPGEVSFPSNDIIFAIGLLVIAVIPSIVMLYWQRSVSKSDEEAKAWKTDMEARMKAVEAKGHEQDLAIQGKVTREDLEKTTKIVFDEIKDLRASFDSKFDSFQKMVLDALQRPR